jgi:hypothetical protein
MVNVSHAFSFVLCGTVFMSNDILVGDMKPYHENRDRHETRESYRSWCEEHSTSPSTFWLSMSIICVMSCLRRVSPSDKEAFHGLDRYMPSQDGGDFELTKSSQANAAGSFDVSIGITSPLLKPWQGTNL